MVIHPWAWGILALVAIGLVVIDFLGHARNPHPLDGPCSTSDSPGFSASVSG